MALLPAVTVVRELAEGTLVRLQAAAPDSTTKTPRVPESTMAAVSWAVERTSGRSRRSTRCRGVLPMAPAAPSMRPDHSLSRRAAPARAAPGSGPRTPRGAGG
ncbi:hypothetical protein [Streptomyces sp. NPDC018584]|uniref:hypothetical protein n=1 Tax=unclassified Streptomyces TaxID=2593676 RepID=UPI0037872A9F